LVINAFITYLGNFIDITSRIKLGQVNKYASENLLSTIIYLCKY